MKKSGLWVVMLALAVAVGLAACTKTVVVKQGPEVLLPGEMIESVDANVIRVKCQGTGYDMNSAVLNARKGCVEWVVLNQLAQTPGERQAYKGQQQALFSQIDKYIGIPGPGAASGKGKGIKSRISMGEDQLKVVLIEDVQKKQLTDDLVEMGVLTSKSDMQAGVGMPTLMVWPSKANKGKKNRKIMEDLVNSYLTKAKWEVLDPQGAADLNKIVDAIGEVEDAEEDEAAKIAQALGADVYIVFEANQIKGRSGNSVRVSVGINAYETTTSRKLASDTALSAERVSSKWKAGEEEAAIQEALSDAMAKVLPQITDYWKEDAPKGNRFSIVLKNAPKNADIKLSGALKRSCSFVKVALSTKKSVKFYAQCKGDNMEMAGALSEAIDGKLSGNEYEFLAKTGNNLTVLFK